MPTEDAFIRSLEQNPADRNLRLIFADWLEERGHPRGELIRLTDILTQAIEVPGRERLESRLRDLVSGGVQPVGPYFTNNIGMRFAWIPAGTFMMGSPEEENGREDNETQHPVTLTKGYYLGVHLVTQEQWLRVMGTNPSHFKGHANLPVDSVSWDDCQVFIQKLRENDGRTYNLPTGAQWEFACRAGTMTPYYFGETISTDQVNFENNYSSGKFAVGPSRMQTTVVGSFPGNAFGLHDMHGNLFEWCQDWITNIATSEAVSNPRGPDSGEFKLLHGGSWREDHIYCRSAERVRAEPNLGIMDYGFRVALDLD